METEKEFEQQAMISNIKILKKLGITVNRDLDQNFTFQLQGVLMTLTPETSIAKFVCIVAGVKTIVSGGYNVSKISPDNLVKFLFEVGQSIVFENLERLDQKFGLTNKAVGDQNND